MIKTTHSFDEESYDNLSKDYKQAVNYHSKMLFNSFTENMDLIRKSLSSSVAALINDDDRVKVHRKGVIYGTYGSKDLYEPCFNYIYRLRMYSDANKVLKEVDLELVNRLIDYEKVIESSSEELLKPFRDNYLILGQQYNINLSIKTLLSNKQAVVKNKKSSTDGKSSSTHQQVHFEAVDNTEIDDNRTINNTKINNITTIDNHAVVMTANNIIGDDDSTNISTIISQQFVELFEPFQLWWAELATATEGVITLIFYSDTGSPTPQPIFKFISELLLLLEDGYTTQSFQSKLVDSKVFKYGFDKTLIDSSYRETMKGDGFCLYRAIVYLLKLQNGQDQTRDLNLANLEDTNELLECAKGILNNVKNASNPRCKEMSESDKKQCIKFVNVAIKILTDHKNTLMANGKKNQNGNINLPNNAYPGDEVVFASSLTSVVIYEVGVMQGHGSSQLYIPNKKIEAKESISLWDRMSVIEIGELLRTKCNILNEGYQNHFNTLPIYEEDDRLAEQLGDAFSTIFNRILSKRFEIKNRIYQFLIEFKSRATNISQWEHNDKFNMLCRAHFRPSGRVYMHEINDDEQLHSRLLDIKHRFDCTLFEFPPRGMVSIINNLFSIQTLIIVCLNYFSATRFFSKGITYLCHAAYGCRSM